MKRNPVAARDELVRSEASLSEMANLLRVANEKVKTGNLSEERNRLWQLETRLLHHRESLRIIADELKSAAKDTEVLLPRELAELDASFLNAEILVRIGYADFPGLSVQDFFKRLLRMPMDSGRFPTIERVSRNDNEYTIEVVMRRKATLTFSHILPPPISGRAARLMSVEADNGTNPIPLDFVGYVLMTTR
jgi:hypothetical protein